MILAPFFPEIKRLAQRYGIQSFVETGVGPESQGLDAAYACGLRAYGCDVNQKRVEDARKRHPQAIVHTMESLMFLRRWLPVMDGPVFFWLDAHFPEEHEDAPAWPLLFELQAIRAHCQHLEQSVVWCDDMQVVLKAEGDENHKLHPEVATLKPSDYAQVLSQTHDYKLLDWILCLEPK
jgi:hypothetical protein